MSPPYADPLAKSYWEFTHRRDRGERFIRAVRWAKGQLKTLRQQGTVLTREEWKRLRVSLIKSYLDSSYEAGERKPS